MYELLNNGARIIATFEKRPAVRNGSDHQTLIVSWLILILISALFIWLGSGIEGHGHLPEAGRRRDDLHLPGELRPGQYGGGV